MSLKFHPGDIHARASITEQGISPLACRPVCGSLMELIKDWDEADAMTTMTRKSSEVVSKKNCTFRTLPATYADLQEMVTGFCALLWALFGDRSPLYKGVLLIRTTLTSQFCASQQHKYNGRLSKEIMWAIWKIAKASSVLSISQKISLLIEPSSRFHGCTISKTGYTMGTPLAAHRFHTHGSGMPSQRENSNGWNLEPPRRPPLRL